MRHGCMHVRVLEGQRTAPVLEPTLLTPGPQVGLTLQV